MRNSTLAGAITASLWIALASAPAGAAPIADPPGDELSLQALLDEMTAHPGAIDAVLDQSGVELWSNASGLATFTLVAELSPDPDRFQFGMYSAMDPEVQALIFPGGADPFLQKHAEFLDDGSVRIGPTLGSGRITADMGTMFGFFVEDRNAQLLPTLFTEASLNGGSVRAVVFQGDDQTLLQVTPDRAAELFLDTEFIIAFDIDGDSDFNDVIVHAANIVPKVVATPAPSASLLLGLGILALRATRRRAA